ncbi:unnamed protein product [Triticum turgidum subsp. durum]|uniref:Uncharacterized protein n=1 Tax=Triticum turgidum subsp. durum TaxID=4567 RepID=A0A9R0WTE1_TRITD|nr:unnamed protein product [Triticum turgidum subsp. durum]
MAKTEKKKAASSCSSGGPASKRIKGSTGGAMSPSKSGRLSDNTGAPSSPATATSSSTATAFIGSPASHVSYAHLPWIQQRPGSLWQCHGPSLSPGLLPVESVGNDQMTRADGDDGASSTVPCFVATDYNGRLRTSLIHHY